jgi:hypothetical protein
MDRFPVVWRIGRVCVMGCVLLLLLVIGDLSVIQIFLILTRSRLQDFLDGDRITGPQISQSIEN